ncbi:MAG: carboxypeptidase-like regulatory domain-containing protein [Bacteroidia bacterium]
MHFTYSRRRRGLLLGLLLGSLTMVQAQPARDTTLTAQYRGETIADLLRQWEPVFGVRFWGLPDTLATRRPVLDLQSASLGEALGSLLYGTEIGYMYYRSYAVVLGDRTLLAQFFPGTYYQTLRDRATETDDTGGRLLTIGTPEQMATLSQARLEGQVLTRTDSQPVVGARVVLPSLRQGALADSLGRFALSLPVGRYELAVYATGYEAWQGELQVYGPGAVVVGLQEDAYTLSEVVLEAEAPDVRLAATQISVEWLDMKLLAKVPAFLGEADVVKTLLLQPGVSSVGEGAAGFNVRGGSSGQNLLLQDDAILFNANHALGFFSIFNPDLVRRANLYKGNLPAAYGGRLAAVLEVQTREGDFDAFDLRGGIGVAASRLSLEGPVVAGKSSVLLGLRSTYTDGLLSLVNIPDVQASSAFFYDGMLRYTHRFDPKNTLTLSAYSSSDHFRYAQAYGFDYQTNYLHAAWQRVVSDRLLYRASVVASRYTSTRDELTPSSASSLDNRVDYVQGRVMAILHPRAGWTVEGGLSSIWYGVDPGTLRPQGVASYVVPKTASREQGIESAVYAMATWEPGQRLGISGGIRLSRYAYLGPQRVWTYELGSWTISDSVDYGSWAPIASYVIPEPRISARLRLNESASIKAGYSRTAQFINQISNTDVPAPSDTWKLSTGYLEPFRSHNASLGYFQQFRDRRWEASAEVFGRRIGTLYDYRDFADLAANPRLETELLPGRGRAYGLELSLRMQEKRFDGWVSYTRSRTEQQIEGINDGAWFPANFDQPNNFSAVLNYQVNQRNGLTINFTYISGRPTTAPIGVYVLPQGLTVADYSLRNQLRIPDYHRLDLAYTISHGYKRKRRFNTSWTFAVYNVYARRNAFSVYYQQYLRGIPQPVRFAVLGTAFPSLTLNFDML